MLYTHLSDQVVHCTVSVLNHLSWTRHLLYSCACILYCSYLISFQPPLRLNSDFLECLYKNVRSTLGCTYLCMHEDGIRASAQACVVGHCKNVKFLCYDCLQNSKFYACGRLIIVFVPTHVAKVKHRLPQAITYHCGTMINAYFVNF